MNNLVSLSSRSLSFFVHVASGFGKPVKGIVMENSSPAFTIISFTAPTSILGLSGKTKKIIDYTA